MGLKLCRLVFGKFNCHGRFRSMTL